MVVQLEEYLRPEKFAQISYWIGAVLLALTLFFKVMVSFSLVSGLYEIQMPFGLLFLIITCCSIGLAVLIFVNIYYFLDKNETEGFFVPLTKLTVLLFIVSIVLSIDFIADIIYYTIRIAKASP